MENKIYDKIEVIVKNKGLLTESLNGGGRCLEFEKCSYYYTGNCLVISKCSDKLSENVERILEVTNEIISLDSIIKFKCSENVKKED